MLNFPTFADNCPLHLFCELYSAKQQPCSAFLSERIVGCEEVVHLKVHHFSWLARLLFLCGCFLRRASTSLFRRVLVVLVVHNDLVGALEQTRERINHVGCA